jgi:hypothetical protein
MKNKLALAALAIAVLTLEPSLHAACTSATMLGNWGFTGTGTIILPTGPLPVAAVGSISFDLNGNASGSQERSLGGQFQHETISGTYTIASDCTLSIVSNIYDDAGNLQRTTTLSGIVVSNGKAGHVIYQSIVLPNGIPLPSVLTADANKI